jgi:hypothetical protein
MNRRIPLLVLLGAAALGIAWWLLRPGPSAPLAEPVAPEVAPRVAYVPAVPAPRATTPDLPFLVREQVPGNRDGAPPPEPHDDMDDPRIQAALRGDLPTGLGPPPSDLIEEREDALRACWAQHRPADGGEGQIVSLRFTIRSEEEENGDVLGRVAEVRELDAAGAVTGEPGAFERCARTAVEDIEFIAPEEGAWVQVSVPLRLRAGG